MKVKYPMEAFALSMVVFSQNMKDALITGILILLITTLGLLLDQLFGKMIPKWSRNSCIIILMTALTYSLFQVILIAVLGYETTNMAEILHVFLGILIAKHIIYAEGDTDYNRLLFEGAGAYAALLIISIIREFMAAGAVHGYKLAESGYFSPGFSQAGTGLLLAGIGIAILNRMYNKNKSDFPKSDGFLVIIPVVLASQPFTIDSISSSVSMVIVVLATLLLVYSVRKYLVFSRISKEIKHMPVELVSASLIYMVLAMF